MNGWDMILKVYFEKKQTNKQKKNNILNKIIMNQSNQFESYM